MRTTKILVTAAVGTALALLQGCGAAPVPSVAYTFAGEAGGVWFVEQRTTRSTRQYLVVCNARRTPPCARVLPENMRGRQDVLAWLRSEQPAPEPQPRPRAPSPPDGTIRAPSPPPDGEALADPSATLAPEPGTAQPGFIAVMTREGWANVYDDAGRFLGQTPVLLQMEPGTHRLRLRPFGQPPGDRPEDELTVYVAPGVTTRIVRDVGQPPPTP